MPLLLGSLVFGQSTTRTMTMMNGDVIDLVKNGLSEEIVVADIEAAPPTQFDTSVDGLKQLQEAHVPVGVQQHR